MLDSRKKALMPASGCASRYRLTRSVMGLTIQTQTRGVIAAKATETRIGRTTVIQLKLLPPRLEMTWTMTRPTTSSIIAALVRTTPRREVASPLELRTVNVVPRLVEHSAAPAAKA